MGSVPPWQHKSVQPRFGKTAEAIRRLTPTMDVIHVAESEEDILHCTETCYDTTQHVEEAHRSGNEKTITLDTIVYSTLKTNFKNWSSQISSQNLQGTRGTSLANNLKKI